MNNNEPSFDETNKQNLLQFGHYYNKPSWWFKFRYDTQIKRKTCLHLVKEAGKSLRNKRILEIGFGSGETLFSFAADCEIFGIELSDSAISHARQRAYQLGFSCANFYHASEDATLPFTDGYFDIVIASHVIEHVGDDLKLLSEMHRIIRQDGIAILLIPINEKYLDPNHIHRYTPGEFDAITQKSGFHTLFSFQNELLFHLVERFYYENYSHRWKIIGPLITALFNIPTSILPFTVYTWIDKIMERLGFLPRQAGFVLTR